MKIEATVERSKPASDSERLGGTRRHVDLWAAGLFINYPELYWNPKEEQRKRVRQEKRKSDDGMRGFRTVKPLGESGFSVLIKIFQYDLFLSVAFNGFLPVCSSDSTTTARCSVAPLHPDEASPAPLAVGVETEQPLALLPPAYRHQSV